MIEIYPSRLDGEPLERHPLVRPMSIRAWLVENVKNYSDQERPPISIGIIPAEVERCEDLSDAQKRAHEELIHPSEWDARIIERGDVVRIYPEPRGTDPFTITAALFKGVQAAFRMLMPQLPGMPANPGQGESLADSSPRGNKVKLGEFAVEINFFTYRGLTHAWTVAIPVCYRFSAFRCAPSGAWVDPAGIRGVPQPAS
ncbi:hypothetical protein ACFELG_15265 [Pseudomonas aeruginosa]|uniref:hypothetical protein n=1 Tax=Pseudomonas aeruginosa TaxID=287 RepID=UPI00383BDAEC